MIGGVTVVAVATRRRRNEDVVVVVVATGNSDVTNGSTRITMAVVQGGRGGGRGEGSPSQSSGKRLREIWRRCGRYIFFPFSTSHHSRKAHTHTHRQTKACAVSTLLSRPIVSLIHTNCFGGPTPVMFFFLPLPHNFMSWWFCVCVCVCERHL